VKNAADEVQFEAEVEEEAYVEYDIATYPSDYTIDGLQQMTIRKDIVIPGFQRHFVWNIRQASLLVESFLLGLPVPPLFLYVTDQNKSEVIDGQQRLLSMMYFLEGYFGLPDKAGRRQIFRLSGLSEKSPFRGKTFSTLEEKYQRKIRSSVLRAINVKQLSPKKDNTSVFHIFERLNTGGTSLKPQEIRNAVFRGDIVERLREINNNKTWQTILGLKSPDKFQRDVELVLRIFSLYENWEEYEKPMKEFLNISMQRNRSFDSPEALAFGELFDNAVQKIVLALGERPFRPRRVISVAILESVIVTVLECKNLTIEQLRDNYNKLLEDELFQKTLSGATTDTKVLKERMRRAKIILDQ
jgi:hypothetical protein